MKTIVKIILSILALILIVSFTSKAIDKSEISECMNLQNQASQYTGFYITSWQNDMCQSHNIVVDAVVK